MNRLARPGVLVAFLGALAVAAAPVMAQGSITITSWGGAYSESQRKAYFEPFTRETGITVLANEWSGELARVRAMVETGNYQSHVVDLETDSVIAGCREGLLERLDYQLLGFSPDDMLDGAANDCAVGTVSWSTVLVYDEARFGDAGPKSWADFWDVERFPGKRGLYKSPKFNIEFALIADGVAPQDVNAVLRADPVGAVDRAFAKLDELKPHIVWWESGTQAPRLLAGGRVVMSSMWNGRAYRAIVEDGKSFRIVWNGQGLDFDWWAIPAGHPEKELAHRFIAFASRPDRQGEQTNYIAYGPLRKGAYQYVKPEMLEHLPNAPLHHRDMFVIDGEWWGEHRESLSERFKVWLAQ